MLPEAFFIGIVCHRSSLLGHRGGLALLAFLRILTGQTAPLPKSQQRLACALEVMSTWAELPQDVPGPVIAWGGLCGLLGHGHRLYRHGVQVRSVEGHGRGLYVALLWRTIDV
jgi:hypothetical protein